MGAVVARILDGESTMDQGDPSLGIKGATMAIGTAVGDLPAHRLHRLGWIGDAFSWIYETCDSTHDWSPPPLLGRLERV